MNYKDFENALEVLQIVSRTTNIELKNKYQLLSKKYHPDMPDGNDKKFREINEAYKLIQNYMKNFRYDLNEDEFYRQNPFLRNSSDWFYNF